MSHETPAKGSDSGDAEPPASDEDEAVLSASDEDEAVPTDGPIRVRATGLDVSRLQAHIESLRPALSSPALRSDLLRTFETLQATAASFAASQMKLLDGFTPPVLLTSELDATIKAANLIASNSALSAWRESLKTQKTWMDPDFLRAIAVPPHIAQHISSLSLTTARLTEIAALSIKPAEFMSASSVRALSAYSRSFSTEVTRRQLDVVHFGTSSVNASVGAELASLGEEPDEITGNLNEIDLLVVEPWRRERLRAMDSLTETLAAIDASVPEMLAGAWDDIERMGPAAVSKTANCLVEAVDRTLRGLAPDDLVKEWTSEAGRGDLLHEGRPTRSARVCFILRADPSAASIADGLDTTIAKAATRLNSRLQKAKHTTGSAVREITCLAVAVEGLLALVTGLSTRIEDDSTD